MYLSIIAFCAIDVNLFLFISLQAILRVIKLNFAMLRSRFLPLFQRTDEIIEDVIQMLKT